MMRPTFFVVVSIFSAAFPIGSCVESIKGQQPLRFQITVPSGTRQENLTGRAFVVISRVANPEPRLQAGGYASVPLFGVDVVNQKSGDPLIIDAATLGYPPRTLSEIPVGDYYVQAVINVYSQFRRSDGHTIWAHDDQWEGQHWNRSPGNLYSAVEKIHLDPRRSGTIALRADLVIPQIQIPADTEWVKHVKIQSKLLSTFWGRPIYLGATILLPKGYEASPERTYPAIYSQTHFGLGPPFNFTLDEVPETIAQRAQRESNGAERPIEFSRAWASGDLPSMIAVTFQHPTPYYDDSYAVNSANNGPYGDALVTELIPAGQHL